MSPDDVLHVDRFVAAPVRAVWDAWTTERGLARWWWAGWADTTHSVDARVGGGYRFEAPAAGIAVHGEYLVVDPPHRLEMTWVWSDADGSGPTEHVLVELVDDGDGTTVRIRHTGPWTTPEPAANYRQGWEHVLERLVAASSADGAPAERAG